MRRLMICWITFASFLGLALVAAGCVASSRAATLPSPTDTAKPVVEAIESLTILDPQPTEGPDPVATEYALAEQLATPTAVAAHSIVEATPDVLGQLEAHANRPTPVPPPDRVNDLPIDVFVLMDDAVIDRVREVFAKGRSLGRNPQAFSKAGDSTIESPYFLGRFDGGSYNLGNYRYLQAVVDHFQGSYARQSAAVRIGQHSWTLLNPAWADKKQCQADESPLACEFRLNNPSVLILRLGANDAGVPKLFEKNMRAVVEYTIEQGVIPVLSTKPDQRQGTTQVNDILRVIAADYEIPVWDFARVAETLPGRGLGSDGVHLTGFYQHDYTLPQAFQRGHGMQNLTALIVLDEIWQTLESR